MTPASQTQSGDPGEVVTHTYTITNTGDYTDTFGLSVSGAGWTTNAPVDTGPLAAGESVTIDVAVSIPTALPPMEDSFTLTTISGLDSDVTAQSTGTTRTTKWYKFYLPLILN